MNFINEFRKIFKTSSWHVAQITAVFAIARLLSIAIVSVSAHALAITEYGAFLYAYSLAHIVAQLAGLGWYSLIRKKSATFRFLTLNSDATKELQHNESKGFFIASFLAPLFWVILILSLLYGGLHWGYMEASLGKGLSNAFIMILPLLFANILREYLAGLGAVRISVFLGEGFPLFVSIVFILGVPRSTAAEFINIMATSYALSVVVQAIFLGKLLPNRVLHGKAVMNVKSYLISSGQRALGAGSRFLTDKIDVLLLAPSIGVIQMAKFNSANRISLFILLVPLALIEYFSSRISRDFHEGKIGLVKQHVFWQLKALTILLIPISLVSIFLSDRILLAVFGESLQAAADLFPVVLLANIIFAYSLPFSSLLLMTNGENSYSKVNVLSLALCFCFCLLLIRPPFSYGSMGAAISLVLANLALCIGTMFFGFKVLRSVA